MNNVKAIFIDSEGTLRKNKKVDLEASLIVKKLESVGIHVVLTTGLPRFISRDISLKANASRYLISSNGADIYDTTLNKNIKSNCIDLSIVKNIYNLSNLDYNLILGVGDFEYSNLKNEYNLNAKNIENINNIEDSIYQLHISQRNIDLKNDDFDREYKYFLKYNDILELRLLVGEVFFDRIINKKISSFDNFEREILIKGIRFIKLRNLRKEILREYDDFVSVGNESMDFKKFQFEGETPWFSLNKNGINKGYAIKTLCEYLNIDLNNTVGIGNDYNDKSMRSVVETFVCPSDARDFIKEDTNFIYNNDEGVNKVLKKIYERR